MKTAIGSEVRAPGHVPIIGSALQMTTHTPSQSTFGPAWRREPAPGAPEPGAIHVWGADLDALDAHVLESLSPAERERAARFHSSSDGRRWACAHGFLRTVLGRALQRDPSSLAFARSELGRPHLAGSGLTGESPPLEFNLSHSGNLALLAVSRAGKVGVDIEQGRRRVDELAIARRALAPDVASQLELLAPADRRLAFLRAWTHHEASLKCAGTGLTAAGPANGRPAQWTTELEVLPPVAAALAAERAPVELHCWDFG